ISYSHFNMAVGQKSVSKLMFGKSGDRIFFASPDGVSDWIGTVGKGVKNKGVLLSLRNMKTGEVKKSTRFPKYVVRNSRPRPMPIRQADNTDLLAFARVRKGNTL